ncbi:hypothetical protein BZA70DRAFT_168952 [Myxozyma melibiosi]|uniref:Uncharacterized protein n=1 Tax=Myxozyma melibiosi TaxID=54550 RepID=A0ABR1F7H3_9ASCO
MSLYLRRFSPLLCSSFFLHTYSFDLMGFWLHATFLSYFILSFTSYSFRFFLLCVFVFMLEVWEISTKKFDAGCEMRMRMGCEWYESYQHNIYILYHSVLCSYLVDLKLVAMMTISEIR